MSEPPKAPEAWRYTDLGLIVPPLAAFLDLVGPNAPPGYETARDTQVWARCHQVDIVAACAHLCSSVYDGEVSPIDRGHDLDLRAPAWRHRNLSSITMLFDVFEKIIKRWGFAFTRATAFEWGYQKTIMVPAGVPVPPAAVARLPFPLIVTADEHKQLEWVLSQFRAILKQSESLSTETGAPSTANGEPLKAPVPLTSTTQVIVGQQAKTAAPSPETSAPSANHGPVPKIVLTQAERSKAMKDKENEIKSILEKGPSLKAADIAKQVGIDQSTVRRSRPWRNSDASKKRRAKKTNLPTQSLTRKMSAVIPGNDADPAEIAADKEERMSVWRAEYVDTLDERERGRFNDDLSEEKQLDEITSWKTGIAVD